MLIHSAVSDGGTLPNFRMKIATVMSHTAQMSVSGNQDLLETRSSLHYANKSKLGFV